MTAWAPLLALGVALPSGLDVRFVPTTLEPVGDLLGAELVDVFGDRRPEAVLAVRTPQGRRELRLHEIGPAGLVQVPLVTVEILDEVIAWGVAELRPEPGRELFFLTRAGAYSFSTTKPGYRDNVARFVDAPLLYDIADPEALPYWPYVLATGAGERLLLPTLTGPVLYGPDERPENGDGLWKPEVRIEESVTEAAQPPRDRAAAVSFSAAGFSASASLSGGRRLLLDGDPEPARLLASRRSYAAPALLDVDGDGAQDLVFEHEEALHVHLARAGRFALEPDRREAFPDYLKHEDDENVATELQLVDLDGDGDADVIARRRRDGDGLENADINLLLLRNDGKRLFPEQPTQVLRFEAAVLRVDVADANGDGRPDLVLRKFELPGLLGTVTGLEFTLTHLVFFGEKGARFFERKPALEQKRTFDESTIQEAIANRSMRLDADGDGLADLVEVDLAGRIAIRRLRKDKGFFTGTTWTLDESPWKRFGNVGSIESLEVDDWNGDGLVDIASRGSTGFTLILSRRSP